MPTSSYPSVVRNRSDLSSPRKLTSTARLPLLALMLAAEVAMLGCAKKVAVPDLSQQDVTQAEQALTSNQLKVGNVSGLQNGNLQGAYVQTQNPPAGTQVPVNTAIDLVAVPPVQVPDLTNNNVADAVNALQNAGLKVTLVKQPTNNIFGHSKVKQQSAPPNTFVRRDSTIIVTVEAPPNLGSLLGLVTKEPAYEKLNPEYRNVLDQFLKQPDAGAPPATTVGSTPMVVPATPTPTSTPAK